MCDDIQWQTDTHGLWWETREAINDESVMYTPNAPETFFQKNLLFLESIRCILHAALFHFIGWNYNYRPGGGGMDRDGTSGRTVLSPSISPPSALLCTRG